MFDGIAMWMYDHPWGVIGAVTMLGMGLFALVLLVPLDDT